MPSVEWRHNKKSLLLPVVIFPGYHSLNPSESLRVDGLVDTGATGTGIRRDLAEKLTLRAKGQRRVNTANGLIWATEYIIRLGFVPGNYDDPYFSPDAQQPYVLEAELIGFELSPSFSYPILVGMDVICSGDLSIRRDGTARFEFG